MTQGSILWQAPNTCRSGCGRNAKRRNPPQCTRRRRIPPRCWRSLRVSLPHPPAHLEPLALTPSQSATTHTDIILRARALNIPTRVIHNASIMNAVGACGLQLYNFGQTVSLVFFTDTWKPDSFYDRIKENLDLGLHTLVLLDIKVKEQSEENLARCALPHLFVHHLN
jgi:hypothetical protein